MIEPGTSYTAEISTPSGLTFHASAYVPPDAEHDGQHELAEAVMRHASAMLVEHDRGIAARAADPEDRFAGIGACFDPAPTIAGNAVICHLPHGHPGAHRSQSGTEWSNVRRAGS